MDLYAAWLVSIDYLPDRVPSHCLDLHLPYHLIIVMCGVAMIDCILRAFINNVDVTADIPDAIKDNLMSEEVIVVELVVTFGLLFFFNGVLKLIHTFDSEGKAGMNVSQFLYMLMTRFHTLKTSLSNSWRTPVSFSPPFFS